MAQNEKGGADLDIFEDLAKKGAPPRPSSGRSVPPPPPSLRTDVGKRTLLGVTAPAAMPSAPGFPPPPSSPSRLPPPPPGRGSLPPVVAPPSKSAATPAPSPVKAANSVDVDWDDDDEATQVFAEEATHIFAEDATHVLDDDKTKAIPSAPMPAAGMPAPVPSRPKATLLGLTAPQGLPAPSRPPARSTPPPPPVSRSPGLPSGGFSFPPTINPGGPAPSSTQRGLGHAGAAPWSSLPPPPAMPSMQGMPALPRQASTPEYATPPPRNMEATQMLAPRVSPVGMRLIIGAAIGLAALAIFLVVAPSKGSIVINVSDQHGSPVNRLDVFVDGKKTPFCDTAPCTIPDQGTGSHEVKVLVEGYDAPAVQAVVVEARRPTSANFTVGSSRGTGIKVSGVQAGVKLYVDDKELGPLPQDIHDLSPGDHVIRVAGSERYQPLVQHVTVERDRVEDLGTITLKVLKGKVTVAPGTGGARVYIVSGSDRRELPMLPISVDIDTTKSWSLEASKPGYEDYRQLISFDDGQAEKAYTVTLEPKGAGSPPPAAPAPYYNPSPGPVAAAPRSNPTPAPPPAAEGGESFLNINSIPPSTCFLDGRSLGSTPRVHVSVKPGAHTVKFVDSDDGLTKTIFVSVGAGETKPAVTKLN
ncbi:MAG: PEGA domain-containing protein [Polyangiaceae bacterium]